MPKLGYKIICAVLCAVFTLGMFPVGSVRGAVEYDSYSTGGFEPTLPIIADSLVITSVDYYYEDKNDSLPGLHGGIDIVASMGTDVVSVYAGEVTHRGFDGNYGYNIIVKHTFGGREFYSRYAHLSEYVAGVGDIVEAGEPIAKSGSSGQSYSPHLHLEIYENSEPSRYERSYTLKYYLGQGTEILSKLKFYIHFISGEYNSQLRTTRLGSGGSCYSRCGLDREHDHISVFAEYIKLFYEISGKYYVYNDSAEASLFSDKTLSEHIYKTYDADGDAHLAFCEVMGVNTLDLRGLSISSLKGTEIFGDITGILTDGDILPIYTLNVNYSIPAEYIPQSGLLGTWKHTDTSGNLRLRSEPSTSSSKVGDIPPQAIIVVTQTQEAGGYLWGKTTYGGVSGWCALDPSWSMQISSTTRDFYVDSNGYVRASSSAELVSESFKGNDSSMLMFDADGFDFLPEGKMFVGWASEPDGEPERIGEDRSVLDVYPPLSFGDKKITLYAVIRDSDVLGDCDGDGLLGEGDVDTLVRYLSGYSDKNTRTDYLDYNGDGKINTRDVIAIKQELSK